MFLIEIYQKYLPRMNSIRIKQAKHSEKIESFFEREYALKIVRTKMTNANTNKTNN